MNDHTIKAGRISIVGAGPGAADLITLRGLKSLREADAVFYDALISPELLAEAPAHAEKVYVGKRCGHHHVEQQQIIALIIDRARQGKKVTRLKGGDPMIFGHGGEEAMACIAAGIPFEIIPGVCSALGAASYAGIPLTHRGWASSVAFVTAHGAKCSESPDLSWLPLAKTADTLIIFMGGSWLQPICDALISDGLAAATPVAVISHATCENQQTVIGSLESIAERVAEVGLSTPVLIVVGEVAQFSAQLNWFERDRTSLCYSETLTSDRQP